MKQKKAKTNILIFMFLFGHYWYLFRVHFLFIFAYCICIQLLLEIIIWILTLLFCIKIEKKENFFVIDDHLWNNIWIVYNMSIMCVTITYIHMWVIFLVPIYEF